MSGWERPIYGRGSEGITHVDEGVLGFLASRGSRTMLDVGCGPGGQVHAALDMGWGAFGIEVDDTVAGGRNVALIDLCVHPVILPAPVDLVWSVEVAEHVPPEHEPNFIRTLTANSSRHIILTANQNPNHVHVNCQPREHWIKQVEEQGFRHDGGLLKEILSASTMKREFLTTTGMVFRRVKW